MYNLPFNAILFLKIFLAIFNEIGSSGSVFSPPCRRASAVAASKAKKQTVVASRSFRLKKKFLSLFFLLTTMHSGSFRGKIVHWNNLCAIFPQKLLLCYSLFYICDTT